MINTTEKISLQQYIYNKFGFTLTKEQRRDCFFDWCKLVGLTQTHIRVVKK